MFKGYGQLLLEGLAMTIKVPLAAFGVTFVLGSIGAAAKLYGGRVFRGLAENSTAVIRCVPSSFF